MSDTAIAQLFDRLRRKVLAVESEAARLTAALAIEKGNAALLRADNERLERELGAERTSRAELVDQVIDWLGQGEEIVREGVAKVGSEGLAAGQDMRAAVLRDLGKLTGEPARERMGTAEFARTFGGPDLQS